jgi:hypothetical protein
MIWQLTKEVCVDLVPKAHIRFSAAFEYFKGFGVRFFPRKMRFVTVFAQEMCMVSAVLLMVRKIYV